MKLRYAIAVLFAALAWPASGADKPAADKAPADPEATKLLAEARAARANWEKFPGFRAKLEINVEGKVVQGTVEVTPKGKVTIQVPESSPEAAWAKDQVASTVGHRLGGGSADDTPCAFADDNKDHPLGRAIRVLNDEFHSSYRIRDRQIIVVNRRMKDSHFTITVMENQLNEDKKYLPVSYVVNSWEGNSQNLSASSTFHHTWERVGGYDLPATLTEVTAKPGGDQTARSLKLSKHELLK
jgi:hypothetical protein